LEKYKKGIIGFALHYFSRYEAIKKLNLSKATSLVSICPTFTIILAWLILKEIPIFQQSGGFFVTIIGVFGLSAVKSKYRIIRKIMLNVH